MALEWVGRTLIDRDGAEIGACTGVFHDDATKVTEWVCSELDGAAVFIPAVGAAESGAQVRVTVSRADIASAPSVGGTRHITEDEEEVLYRHYGIPHSRDASPTLLPTEDAQPPAQEAAFGTTSDVEGTSTAAELAGAPAAEEPAPAEPTPAQPDTAELAGAPAAEEPAPAEPAPAGPVTTERAAAPVVAEDVTPRPDYASDIGQPPAEEPAPAVGARRRLAPVVAGVGLVLGAVLGARRLRARRPPTRAERLAERGRVVSAALSARTTQIAASAAPVLETTRQALRRRGRAGAVAGAAPTAAALALAALRRRRSKTSRTTEEDGKQPMSPATPAHL